MNRKQRRAERKVRSLPNIQQEIPMDKILPHLKLENRLVGLKDREGVFVHSFKCLDCGLEFQIHSWRANRHRVGEVLCPECGSRGRMLHRRACINEDKGFGQTNEIFLLNSGVGFVMMEDSTLI